MNIIQFSAVLHDEVQKMVLPICTSPLQAFGVSAALSLLDYRISQLAVQYAEQADILGVIDRQTGDDNLDAIEHVLLNGTQWPQQIGPFRFDKSDAEKIIATIKSQDQMLKAQDQTMKGQAIKWQTQTMKGKRNETGMPARD